MFMIACLLFECNMSVTQKILHGFKPFGLHIIITAIHIFKKKTTQYNIPTNSV